MKARVVVAVAVTVGAVLLPAAAAYAAFPGENGKIAFVGYDFSPRPSGAVYVVEPDGAGLSRLAGGGDPAWSPDGRQVAVGGGNGITIYDLDGGVAAEVPTPHGVADPHWSPDGQRLVFMGVPVGISSDVWVVNVDGSGLANLTNTPDQSDFDPAWSPEGSSIAFTHAPDSTNRTDLWTMRPDGSEQVQLTFDAPPQGNPTWSPDGGRIAFASFPGDPPVIEIVNRDGSGRTTAGPGTAPAWSPDGSRIAFECEVIGICTMNLDGTGRFAISTGLQSFQPDWQPLPVAPPEFKNASKFCHSERERLGEQAFRARYGDNRNGANAHGRCVAAAKQQ